MSTSASPRLQPLGEFIKLDAAGAPRLEGYKCSSCGEVLLEQRRGCPKCTSIGTLVPTALSDRGKLFTYTIVYRSFPGISVPFVSAIVQLDGGGFIKGNLVGIEPKPELLRFDMPVQVQFERMKPTTPDGPDLLRHVFVPVSTSEIH
jgi:uncharacterized protein